MIGERLWDIEKSSQSVCRHVPGRERKNRKRRAGNRTQDSPAADLVNEDLTPELVRDEQKRACRVGGNPACVKCRRPAGREGRRQVDSASRHRRQSPGRTDRPSQDLLGRAECRVQKLFLSRCPAYATVSGGRNGRGVVRCARQGWRVHTRIQGVAYDGTRRGSIDPKRKLPDCAPATATAAE